MLFLTARDDLPGIVEGFESGGLDYMTKPFRKAEVLSRIRTHLERSVCSYGDAWGGAGTIHNRGG